MKVCIIGASGKLGRHLVAQCLERGYAVTAVCREQSVPKLADFEGRIAMLPGMSNDRSVIERAVATADAVLTVLVPWGVQGYATGTAQAVLDFARPQTRLVFSCGWHIQRSQEDHYSRAFLLSIAVFGWLARQIRLADIDDQVAACQRIFNSHDRWTVVRASDLEDGESEGLPQWRPHVGDPALAHNRTRRTDFARFMIEALNNDDLVHLAPAIASRKV